MRTAEEITMRCKLILNQSEIVQLVDKSSSPTATYDMVMVATRNNEIAKAARWLGVLRRDYPDHYTKIIKNNLGHVQMNKAKKGEKDEKGICD
jgi:hypothetical protein